MDYSFSDDIKAIREILGLSQDELAEVTGVTQLTISRNENNTTAASLKFMENVYSYAFSKKIRLNKLKEMFYLEKLESNKKLLFHGSKEKINGDINVNYGRKNNDFGQGFYTGESYEQSVSFISDFKYSSVYFLSFDQSDLKCKRYDVNQEWMLTIAYYRGTIDNYAEHPLIKKLVEQSRDCDYIVAPIADNRMFQIINSFIDGEITDEQCKHCLAATNLGMQYVFVSEKALGQLKILERCYIPGNEREYYKNIRSEDAKLGDDKVKLARRQFRGQGYYIDDILG